jgi:Beta/Gamma crystallin
LDKVNSHKQERNMTKTANKFNSLAQIAFVEDIDQETAANYSGGEGRINDGNNDPDIILYEDSDFRAGSIGINAAVGDGVSYVGNSFNDKTSSVRIIRGQWQFFDDAGYGGATGGVFGPGAYNTVTNSSNDRSSSLRRVG